MSVIAGLMRSLLRALYDGLVRQDVVASADLIFVMAGRMERKYYGLELFRAGVAPRLVLSIDRFEVRKMKKVDVEGVEELQRLRDQTPPDQRHFFMILDRSSPIRTERVRMPAWNTYSEVLAVQAFLEKEPPRRVIVVSTDVHLRRVSLTFSTIFSGSDTEFRYCAVPARLASLRKEDWWRSSQRRLVVGEWIKLWAYRAVFFLPPSAIRRLMRFAKGSQPR